MGIEPATSGWRHPAFRALVLARALPVAKAPARAAGKTFPPAGVEPARWLANEPS